MPNALSSGLVLLTLVASLSSCASSDKPKPSRADGDTAIETPTPTAATPDYLEADIEVGVGPNAVVGGFGSIWVSDHTGSTVTRIDPATNEVLETIVTAGEPTGIVPGHGSIWTYGALAHVVNRIDPRTNKVVAKIKIDSIGTGIIGGVDLDGSMWFPGEEGNVFRIDPTTNKVIATVRVSRTTCSGNIAGGEGSLWWGCGGRIVRIDPATNTVGQTIKLGKGAHSPAVGNGALWVPLLEAGSIARVDPGTGKVTDTFKVGEAVDQLRVTPDELWVRVDDDELVSVDAKTLEVTQRYRLPGAQVPGGGITVAFGSVWAVNFSYHSVWRIDPSK